MVIFALLLLSSVHAELPQLLAVKVAGSCARNACVPKAEYCSEHLPGVYRYLGSPCVGGSACTDCSVAPSGVVRCVCEKIPFMNSATYGQSCGLTTNCADGSECFRPCNTFLFKSQCPSTRCSWRDASKDCVDLEASPSIPAWKSLIVWTDNITEIAATIISSYSDLGVTAVSYADMQTATTGFAIGDRFLVNLVPMDHFFELLDVDMNGVVDESELSSGLASVLESIYTTFEVPPSQRRLMTKLDSLVPALTGSDVAQCLNLTADSSAALVAACADPNLQGQICAADGGKFFCPLDDGTCVVSCGPTCNWLNAEDPSTSRCVPATPSACKTLGKQFCGSSSECVDDCGTACPAMPFDDSVAYTCRVEWWTATPSTNPADWLCLYRRSADQACVSDMDCVYGARKCVNSVCAPLEGTSVCSSDRDCGIGSYCPPDPTGGQDQYYVQHCRPQLEEGDDCMQDTDCNGLFRCNSVDTETTSGFNGVCRRLFSLAVGVASSAPELCMWGQLDQLSGLCSIPTRVPRAGQSCTSDEDCGGPCACTGWWDNDGEGCKKCRAGTGDLANNGETLRNYLFQRGTLCSSVWSDEECMREKPAVSAYWFAYMCELQRLSGGVSLLQPSSGCVDGEAKTDYCR